MRRPGRSVEVLELTLHDDIYLVMGVRDSKGEAGEQQDDINGFNQKRVTGRQALYHTHY
jgi:hypothetical protein